MLIEIRNGKISVVNRERTVALLSPIGRNESLRFYSDEYPLGKYPNTTSEGGKTIFSWEESEINRKVSFPMAEKSYFDDVVKTFSEERGAEGITQTHKTTEFPKLLDSE